jgi:hypothetical protein
MRPTLIFVLLLAVAPASAQSAAPAPSTAARALAAIGRQWRHCQESDDFPTPAMLQDCHSTAIAAANALVARAGTNARFDAFLRDLFEPLLFARTGGGDALSGRVVVDKAYAELAQARAAILTGSGARATDDRSVPVRINMAPALWRRWKAVRDLDCRTYRVPRCVVRLDRAVAMTTSAILSD